MNDKYHETGSVFTNVIRFVGFLICSSKTQAICVIIGVINIVEKCEIYFILLWLVDRIKNQLSQVWSVLVWLNRRGKNRVATILNCKIGTLPLVYLGIPVSDVHIGVNAMREVPNKLRKRLHPWKGRNMSSGGRLILSNSSLSSLPIYIREKFFWQGGRISLNITWLGGLICVYLKTMGAGSTEF